MRWKYQRYMQDYLATVQSVDDNVGRVLDYLDRPASSQQHDRHLHERPGLLPRRSRPVRQAVHVRGIACGCRSSCAGRPGSSPARGATRIGAERRLRADVPRGGRPAGAGGHAGTQPAAGAARPHAARTGARRCTTATTTTRATTTRARTTASARATHKLIYFWKKDQWELFDLVNDPHELHNLYGQPGHEQLTARLKTELLRLKRSARRRRSARERAVAERRGRPRREAPGQISGARYLTNTVTPANHTLLTGFSATPPAVGMSPSDAT